MAVAAIVVVVVVVAAAAVVVVAAAVVAVAVAPFASSPLESRSPGTETPVASQSAGLSTREHSTWRNGVSAVRRPAPSSESAAWL